MTQRLLVDADACPRGAFQTIRRLRPAYGFELITVASVNHVVERQGPWHEHLVVGAEAQATDLALVNRAQPGDVVVTQDWGLAALVLGRGCRAVSPTGRIYRPETIEMLLEERHVKAKVRRGGGRTPGPRARTAQDEQKFERALECALSGETGS